MDGGSQHCTGGHDQNHPQEEETQKGTMVELLQVVTYGCESWTIKKAER